MRSQMQPEVSSTSQTARGALNLWGGTGQSRAPGSGYLGRVSSHLRVRDAKRPCSRQCSKGRGRSCGLFTRLTQHSADSCTTQRTWTSGRQTGHGVGCVRAPSAGHPILGWRLELAGKVGCPFRDQPSEPPAMSPSQHFWGAS